MSYALNTRPLNSAPVNGTGVSAGYLGIDPEETVLTLVQSVYTVDAAATVVTLAQTVGNIDPAETVLTLVQTVNLYQTDPAETVLALAQSVYAVAPAETVVTLSQTVISSLPAQGWDLKLFLGAWEVPHNQLVDVIDISRGAGDAALMTFAIKPPAGTVNLTQYQGKPVICDAITASGIDRLYTGTVDVPEIDLIAGRLTLKCTDRRVEQNNALDPLFVRGIGYHSTAVFSEPDDLHEELTQRLETVEKSWDYDAYGVGRLTDWAPKATPDFILDDPDIYRRNPSVSIANRGRIINRIDIEFEFQYKRLRHRERNFSFDSELTACEYAAWGSPPRVQMLRSAIESAGWPHTNLSITGLDPAGLYNCYGARINWSPRLFTAETQPKLDSDGNQVYDSNGKPVYEQTSRSTTDSTNAYANDATWTAAKRFVQNVSEKITVSIQAPDSIAQYGEVKQEYSHGVTSEYDETQFEDLRAYAPPMSTMTQSANGDWVVNADAEDGAASKLRDMFWCAIRKDITAIRGSHRSNTVTLPVKFMPGVDLQHTIQTTAGRIQCKGKVERVGHRIDVGQNRTADTTVTLALSRIDGSFSGDGSVLITRPAVTDPSVTPATITFGTHTIPIGGEQDDNWTGYIFQQLTPFGAYGSIGAKTPLALIIDTPEIEDESRETKEVTASQTEQIGIRNDSLTVVFE